MADEARLEFNRAYFASRPEPPGLARNRRARERWLRMRPAERRCRHIERMAGLWEPIARSVNWIWEPRRAP
jgi:hypothetical protein